MGYYDGAALTDAASAWQVADTLGLPVLLVVRPGGASLTLAAQIRGLRAFRPDSHLAAILLNECSPGYAARLAPLLERETGLPVILISDGRLLDQNLKSRGYERRWLDKQLAARGLSSPAQVFLLTVDQSGNTYCIRKGGAA